MRLVVCLLLAMAAGFGVYLTGAIVWTVIDPQVAAPSLLFTIPFAIVGTIVPALLGVLALVIRCRIGRRAARRRRAGKPSGASLRGDEVDLEDLHFAT